MLGNSKSKQTDSQVGSAEEIWSLLKVTHNEVGEVYKVYPYHCFSAIYEHH